MTLKNDLIKTINGFNELNCDFTEYDKVYKFTTENIKEYYNKLDFVGKDILTVCSSGDHAINAFIKGAANIDLFDINKLTKYYTDYKIAAIKALNYDEFFDTDQLIYSPELYKKIRENLSHDNKYYFDVLYKFHYSRINSFLYFRVLRYPEYNYYYNKKIYKELKEKIYDFKYDQFYHCNVIDLLNLVNKTYDIILLSNISNYASGIYNKPQKEALKQFNYFIINDLHKLLNKNGKILLAYLYDYQKDTLPVKYNYDYDMINAGLDKVLVYTKK